MNEISQQLGPVSEAVVTDSVRITADNRDEVRRITLRVDDPAFRFSAGQNIGVVVPGPHPMGNEFHMRRYSIASGAIDRNRDAAVLELLVRRCFYIDEISGERYPGIASNHLCDAVAGDSLTITGPFRSPFRMPSDTDANILMIGTGTGVAPFRGLVQEIYREKGSWQGQVRLYYGARSGMDLLYENDEQGDLSNYYDETSFKAFRALIKRPMASDSDALQAAVQDHADDIWQQVQTPNTFVYLAGLDKIAATFGAVMVKAAGSEKAWNRQLNRLRSEGRWSELIYS